MHTPALNGNPFNSLSLPTRPSQVRSIRPGNAKQPKMAHFAREIIPAFGSFDCHFNRQRGLHFPGPVLNRRTGGVKWRPGPAGGLPCLVRQLRHGWLQSTVPSHLSHLPPVVRRPPAARSPPARRTLARPARSSARARAVGFDTSAATRQSGAVTRPDQSDGSRV